MPLGILEMSKLGTELHVAETRLPLVHEVAPEGAQPLLQVGWQVDPEANVLVQVPLAPLAGAAEASHGNGAATAMRIQFQPKIDYLIK